MHNLFQRHLLLGHRELYLRNSTYCTYINQQGLHAGADHFFRFLSFLFLAILVAESQVLVIASLIPVFIAALAICALYVLHSAWHMAHI